MTFKDEVLSALGRRWNVAQFVSFGPHDEPTQRHSCVRGFPPDHVFASAAEGIEAVLQRGTAGTVNVRSFSPTSPKGSTFTYGLASVDEVVALVRQQGRQGLYSIVNETIDVHDGGVSGVLLGGIAEFAPDDTPRAVEKEGACSLPEPVAMTVLQTVYGFAPELEAKPDERVEFSLHPLRVGYRNGHTIVWEVERVDEVDLNPRLRWPNRFSRIVGDKAFGLLIAHALGAPVPRTTVIARRVAPFSFGRPTGTAEQWIRTCPTEQQPGRFTTHHGWTDPYELLGHEDPEGTQIASVLSQEGVDARFSGATMPQESSDDLVEGVRGFGDAFMQGEVAPEPLPQTVLGGVREALSEIRERIGPSRMEWADDGQTLWVLQLHQSATMRTGVLYPGDAQRWRTFDVSSGLDELRALIADLGPEEGVRVIGDVGITSHVGDILRKARVPARVQPSSSAN